MTKHKIPADMQKRIKEAEKKLKMFDTLVSHFSKQKSMDSSKKK